MAACLGRFSSHHGVRGYSSLLAIPPPAFEYQYVEGVEVLEDYRPGGYHPVQIDDRLHSRYRIIHKLGHGTYSTAWLALDEQTSEYVAVKVGTADADKREADILSQISPGITATGSEAASTLPLALDRFFIDGPNGTHPCLAIVPARCSLRDAKEASDWRLFQLNVARSLAAQLVMAVFHVHSQGFAHGDLHLGITGDELTLGEAKFLLIDFGVAFRPSDESRFQSYTPLVLRPPEAFFEPTTPLSFTSDIWSLSCAIFELLGHRPLVDGIIAPQDDITAQQEKWVLRAKWFDATGKPLSNERDIWSWDRRFDEWVNGLRPSWGAEVVKGDEKAALLELLRWMLAWRPCERPSVDEVLKSAWMKQWALPAYKEGRKTWK
ncbi:kinase-like domain-containing protein [Immersiella caudata]|uniref:non-specific serine/threonine protein kinase n=1 Tax=Immersiella caudata TaxID=314043 RepID=A0AA39WFU5_9PEZI|nr:kinase-like domain-containing protein [Immersiella caudata]